MNTTQLKKNLKSHIQEIQVTADIFPWHDKRAYAMWLRQTYSFVCHSTRLLTLASAHTSDEKLHYRFMDHAVEEKAHEKLLETWVSLLRGEISESCGFEKRSIAA